MMKGDKIKHVWEKQKMVLIRHCMIYNELIEMLSDHLYIDKDEILSI